MPGPTQPWDQPEDPRENTVDLPRVDLAGLADYFRGAAPPPRPAAPAQPPIAPPQIPAGATEPVAGQADPPSGLVESQTRADPGSLVDTGSVADTESLAESQTSAESQAGPSARAGTASAPVAAGSAAAGSATGVSIAASRGAVTADVAAAGMATGSAGGGSLAAADPEYGSSVGAGPAVRTAAGEVTAGSEPVSYAPAARPAPGSLADLRSRLSRLPAGHPSSPYDDSGQARPLPTRLKHLELGLPAPAREPGDLPAGSDIGVWETALPADTGRAAPAVGLLATAAGQTAAGAANHTGPGAADLATAGETTDDADLTTSAADLTTGAADLTTGAAAGFDRLTERPERTAGRSAENVAEDGQAAFAEKEQRTANSEPARHVAGQNGSRELADTPPRPRWQDPYAVDSADNGHPYRDSGPGIRPGQGSPIGPGGPAGRGGLELRPWTADDRSEGRQLTNGGHNGDGGNGSNGHRQLRPEQGRADFGPVDRDPVHRDPVDRDWSDPSRPHSWPLRQPGPDRDLGADHSFPPKRNPRADYNLGSDHSFPPERNPRADYNLGPDHSFPPERNPGPDHSLPPDRGLGPDHSPWAPGRNAFDDRRPEPRQRDTAQNRTQRPDSRRPDASRRDTSRQDLRPPDATRPSAPPPRTPPGASRPSGPRPAASPIDADSLTDLVERTLTACRAAEGQNMYGGYGSSGLTPVIHRLAAQLPAGGLAPGSEADSLKSPDRFAAKLAKLIGRNPGRPPDELAASISDAVRYAFAFEADDYTECTWLVHRKLKAQGFELQTRRNRWDSPEHKGIFTSWHDPAHGIGFEVQFHTMASWDAAKRTHDAYLRITDPATGAGERAQLRARQVLAAASAAAPPGCMEIADWRAEQR